MATIDELSLYKKESVRLVTEVRTLRRQHQDILLVVEKLLRTTEPTSKNKAALKRAQSLLDKTRETKGH